MKNFEVKSLNGDYTFFDIETTGTANTDEVIEIAALKIRDDKVIAEFKKLINTNVEINRYAYDLHHISKKMLENESDFKTVISMFVDFIESDVIVGHNIKNFDISFINRNCEKYGIAPLLNNYFDTLPYARECLPQLKCHSLEYLSTVYELDAKNEHRALADCRCNFEVYKAILNNYSLKENVLVLAPAPKKKDYTKTEYKQETKELQILTGILTGITCDNILNNDEVYTLKTWLEGHSELNGNYPFDVAIKSINKALEDNVLEQHELDELLITFKSILDPTSVCSSCKIEFQDKKFCLTGDFISGSKDDIKDIIIKLGGQILTVSSRNLNYLILGGKGSEKYSNGNYGNKYKKAMELNEKGCNIQIINENEFISCIKEVCICG